MSPLPLTRGGRRLFATQWYRAVRSHLDDGLTAADAEGRAEDLAKAAEGVADLAENPLLLSILALVHFNRQGLPVERSTLYDHATLAMLGHWERDPAGRDLGEIPGLAALGSRHRLNEAAIRRVVECLAREVPENRPSRRRVLQVDRSLSVGPGFGSSGCSTYRRCVSDGPGASASAHRAIRHDPGAESRRPRVCSPSVFKTIWRHVGLSAVVEAADLAELARLASEPRNSEVIRFAVAILAADQRAEADDRALRLVEEVAPRDAVLAAACLFEARRINLAEAALQALARRVWGECASMWRRHHHPLVASRLIWTLLERSSTADDLLLEFLTQGSDGHRRPMEGEMELALLSNRPPVAVSARLLWFLQRLARTSDSGSWRPLSSIATLLMIEAGVEKAEEDLAPLTRLLGQDHWHKGGRGTLAERAERVFRETQGVQRERVSETCLIVPVSPAAGPEITIERDTPPQGCWLS